MTGPKDNYVQYEPSELYGVQWREGWCSESSGGNSENEMGMDKKEVAT